MSRFAADWLALREAADMPARNQELARRFVSALPRPRRIVDLGAGTGANARALAPLIGGDQEWYLVEHDAALRGAMHDGMIAWAGQKGHRATVEGDSVVVATESGSRWRFVDQALDLAGGWERLDALPQGVTAAALFDLVSVAWLDRLADWLAARRLPLLAALTVDGRREWRPALPEDAAVEAAFRRHQTRDKGLGPALGGAAPAALARALAARGFTIATAASDWRLGAGDGALLTALVAGEAAAACEAGAEPTTIATWERQRAAAVERGALELVVGHRDLLALPAQI